MAQWIDFYNNERLHGALLYLTPKDYFAGRKEVRLAERKEKLHTADINNVQNILLKIKKMSCI